jgi:hypothetical protein
MKQTTEGRTIEIIYSIYICILQYIEVKRRVAYDYIVQLSIELARLQRRA